MQLVRRLVHRLHDIAQFVMLIIAAMCYGMNGAEFVSEEDEK